LGPIADVGRTIYRTHRPIKGDKVTSSWADHLADELTEAADMIGGMELGDETQTRLLEAAARVLRRASKALDAEERDVMLSPMTVA
jgi:hypothetical protein